jgi:uncharacterized protein (DUF488 family)
LPDRKGLSTVIIYTWGYTGSSHEDLKAFMKATGAVLCDIRFNPRSRQPHWNVGAIVDLVGADNYVHIKGLGNRNYKGDGIVKLDNPALGISTVQDILLRGRDVILMCACKDAYGCHRWDAARAIANV